MTKLKLTIKGQEIELTLDEAEALHGELARLFSKPAPAPYVPWPMPVVDRDPQPFVPNPIYGPSPIWIAPCNPSITPVWMSGPTC